MLTYHQCTIGCLPSPPKMLTSGVHAAKASGPPLSFLHWEMFCLTPRQFPFSFSRGDKLQPNGIMISGLSGLTCQKISSSNPTTQRSI